MSRERNAKRIEGIIDEDKGTFLKKDNDRAVGDAAIIAGAQKVEHYEIASYGSAYDPGRNRWGIGSYRADPAANAR